jgi:hypothetical protein
VSHTLLSPCIGFDTPHYTQGGIAGQLSAWYFLPSYTIETLVTGAKRLVELFYPRLVLGISDEIPPDGDIERVRLVGELAKELVG